MALKNARSYVATDRWPYPRRSVSRPYQCGQCQRLQGSLIAWLGKTNARFQTGRVALAYAFLPAKTRHLRLGQTPNLAALAAGKPQQHALAEPPEYLRQLAPLAPLSCAKSAPFAPQGRPALAPCVAGARASSGCEGRCPAPRPAMFPSALIAVAGWYHRFGGETTTPRPSCRYRARAAFLPAPPPAL